MIFLTKDKCKVIARMEHLEQHKSVIPFLDEALGVIDTIDRGFVKTSVDFGRVIGKSDLVRTDESDKDNIIYATREGRPWPSRFVVGREPTDSTKATVILRRVGKRKYIMLTAFIGGLSEREVGDYSIRTEKDYQTSLNFWNNHALAVSSVEELRTIGVVV